MYTCDNRFHAYYNEKASDCAGFLKHAAAYWAEELAAILF